MTLEKKEEMQEVVEDGTVCLNQRVQGGGMPRHLVDPITTDSEYEEASEGLNLTITLTLT